MEETYTDFYRHYHDRNPVNIIATGESRWDNGKTVVRYHSDMTAIELTLGGEGIFTNNGETFRLFCGDLFLLRRGTSHTYTNAPGTEWHKLYVTLSGELTETLLDAYLPKNQYVLRVAPELIEPVLRKILQSADANGEDYNAFLSDALPEVLRLLMLISKISLEKEETLSDRVRAYLDAHIEYPLTLDILTTEFGYSKNHIINIFKAKFGQTPYQYYTTQKLAAAKFYLTNTDTPLSALSDRLAFPDGPYFSSWFKANCGVSPTTYRKRCASTTPFFKEESTK